MRSAQVQSGGSFDIDYEVTGPSGKVILDGEKERQGDFVFTALDAGEYKFCFNNEMSTFADKFVDFEIAVSHPVQLRSVPRVNPLAERVCFYCRSRTNPASRCRRSRAPPQSRRRRWRSRS